MRACLELDCDDNDEADQAGRFQGIRPTCEAHA